MHCRKRSPARRLLSLGLLLLIPTIGCGKSVPPPRYVVARGGVSVVRPETGELEVRLTSEAGTAPAPARALEFCIVTEHSEVYLDDALVTLGAIRRGDEIEIIGYRDPSLRNEKFVISFAYCKRPKPRVGVPVRTDRWASLAVGRGG